MESGRLNDLQKHQRRSFVNKLLNAYNREEKLHILNIANDYVEGNATIDTLWKQIREDAQ
jgi:hypothetical protein